LQVLTAEEYDVRAMKDVRRGAIDAARGATVFGLILGTLGRQGSPSIFKRLRALLQVCHEPRLTAVPRPACADD